MEPPTGFWASLLSFLKFLPYFCGLLVLGLIKGDVLFCLFLSADFNPCIQFELMLKWEGCQRPSCDLCL
jgi:hypothetical protein